MKRLFFMRTTAPASVASRAVALVMQILVAKHDPIHTGVAATPLAAMSPTFSSRHEGG